MNFRKANKEDIPHLCKLLYQLFEQEAEFEANTENQTYALKKIIEDQTIGEIFVALKNGQIVGMVNLLYTISTALGAKVAILEDMIIDKNCQKEGIGSNLLEFALENIKNNGCKRVTLLTDEDNTKAHEFYKKFGFSKSSMTIFRMAL